MAQRITDAELAARFQRLLVRDPGTGCVEWQGTQNRDGYGVCYVANPRTMERGATTTHRHAWELANGPIPGDLSVLHRCDNPPCANVDHLWLGTQADNIRDRDKKGRQGAARGVVAETAKLTDAMVLSIRKEYAAGGVTQPAIAARYGVAQVTVSKVVRGDTWAHIGGPRTKAPARARRT